MNSPTTDSLPRFFAVTTPGLSATRWLSFVLAARPDVFVAHGKHPLDAVVQGQFSEEKEKTDLDSLVHGNTMRELYEGQSLETVLARFQETRPQARVFGCVHSYTVNTLMQAARSPQTLANMRILNLVRHPVNYIASHYALVRSAEKHPRLYQHYVEGAFPQAFQEVPELFLMPCQDHRAFLAFAASCQGVVNLIRDLSYPGIRSVRMEDVTTKADVLKSVCEELTGLTYEQEMLQPFLNRGAINQHRSPGASKDPHAVFGNWETWQQDMAQMMIPKSVLDWLEGLSYDVTMLRGPTATASKPTAPSTSTSPSTEPMAGCLADHLRAWTNGIRS